MNILTEYVDVDLFSAITNQLTTIINSINDSSVARFRQALTAFEQLSDGDIDGRPRLIIHDNDSRLAVKRLSAAAAVVYFDIYDNQVWNDYNFSEDYMRQFLFVIISPFFDRRADRLPDDKNHPLMMAVILLRNVLPWHVGRVRTDVR